MRRAYGESIVGAKNLDSIDNAWYERWLSIVRLSGRLYSLPGFAMGCRYVDQLLKCFTRLHWQLLLRAGCFFCQLYYRETALFVKVMMLGGSWVED